MFVVLVVLVEFEGPEVLGGWSGDDHPLPDGSATHAENEVSGCDLEHPQLVHGVPVSSEEFVDGSLGLRHLVIDVVEVVGEEGDGEERHNSDAAIDPVSQALVVRLDVVLWL